MATATTSRHFVRFTEDRLIGPIVSAIRVITDAPLHIVPEEGGGRSTILLETDDYGLAERAMELADIVFATDSLATVPSLSNTRHFGRIANARP